MQKKTDANFGKLIDYFLVAAFGLGIVLTLLALTAAALGVRWLWLNT